MPKTLFLRSLTLLTLGVSLSACSTLPTPKAAQPAITETTLGVGASTELSTQAVGRQITLVAGQTQQINIKVGGVAATPGQLAWTSSNAVSVGVTQGGLVRAVKAGSSVVRVTLVASPSTFIDFPVTVTLPGAPAPTPVPVPAPTPAPTPGASAYAQSVLNLTNAARAVARSCGSVSYAAVSALTLSSQLGSAAQAHAADMAAKSYFSHTSADGRTFDARVNAAGYLWSTLGENIAAGQPTPESVVSGWIASPGHCSNIMNGSFTQLGVGYATGGAYGSYWVQDFGRPR